MGSKSIRDIDKTQIIRDFDNIFLAQKLHIDINIILATGMLITGSINTLSKKAQNDCTVGYNNSHGAPPHKFDHPWFQTLVMFTGESLCLIGFAIQRIRENRKLQISREEEFTAWNTNREYIHYKKPPVCHWIFILPTLCDLTGTTLAGAYKLVLYRNVMYCFACSFYFKGIGLVIVNASVWQMLRGSIIVFTGILSVLFLKRKLKCFHWVGILLVVFGLCVVGLSDVFGQDQSHSGWRVIVGIILIVAGQLASAAQMVVEESFLKKRRFAPLQVVGMEGLFGVILTAGVVLPILYHINVNGKPYEDGLDAIYQIMNNWVLLGMTCIFLCFQCVLFTTDVHMFIVLYLTSIIFYNYCGLAVTKSLTAVHRTLIDALRTIVIWVVELVIYYAGAESFGEGFSWWSFVQLDGFVFLLMGTLLYYEIVEVQCLGASKTTLERFFEKSKTGENSDSVTLLGDKSEDDGNDEYGNSE
ncbi:solute carrier family 35 member F6-like isoform X2 [Corticium candelabrum]|nr:solute carrier family 35 member F6-like isoform X2 [Corticium candelabrum]